MHTEKTCLHWIKCFILFHGKHYPNTMAGDEVRGFLSHLANDAHLSTNTQILCAEARAACA